MILVLKLVFVHLICDFFMQSDASIKDKEQKKFKSPMLFVHVLQHTIFTFLILLPHSFGKYIAVAPIIFITHWLIDASKLHFQGKKAKSRKKWFIGDQLAHFSVIGGVWFLFEGSLELFDGITTEQILLPLVFVALLTNPSAILIKILISDWSPKEKEGHKSLANAGKYIGILERLFIFGFVVSNYWEGIGFLLAAKSVFRFGDLNKEKDRNLTEYILIGTLISFGIAILAGVLYTFINP